MFYYFIGKFSIYLMKKEQKVIFAKFQNGQNMPSNRTWWSKILVKKKKGRFVELRQRSERFATHIIALTTEYLEEWMIIIYIDDKCFFFWFVFFPMRTNYSSPGDFMLNPITKSSSLFEGILGTHTYSMPAIYAS